MRLVKDNHQSEPYSRLSITEGQQLTPKPLDSYPVTNHTSVVEEAKPNMMVIEEPSPLKTNE
jgi:hypothetical protein